MAQVNYSSRPFYNFTDEDFKFRFDGENHVVKAGEKEMFPDFIAVHAAKHFIDMIIITKFNKRGVKNPAHVPIRDHKTRLSIAEKCLPTDWKIEVAGAGKQEAIKDVLADKVEESKKEVKEEPKAEAKEEKKEEKKKEVKTHQCGQCEFIAKSNAGLAAHSRKKHPNP